MIEIKNYIPGRFTHLMEKPFARDLWDFLTDENRIAMMITSTESNKPAIEPILTELESRFNDHLSSPDYPEEEISVFANNMVKQILEHKGYEHIGCGRCHQGRYFTSSGLFRKRTLE